MKPESVRYNARHSARIRNWALRLLPLAVLVLAADLAQPGWGQFPNPIFYGQWAINKVRDQWATSDSVEPLADTRLAECKSTPKNHTITEAQAALRDALTGKSSVLAVQWLGTPACQLANGSYRWLLEAGLALDISINQEGEVARAQLTR